MGIERESDPPEKGHDVDVTEELPSAGAVMDALPVRLPAHLAPLVAEAKAAAAERKAAGRGPGGPAPDPAQIRADVEEHKASMRLRAWVATAPERYSTARLAELDAKQHPDLLLRWLASDSQTLFLVGPTGTGKTHAAWATGYEAVCAGKFVRGWEHNAYLAALRPGGSPDDAWLIRKRADGCDILILDDFGSEMDAVDIGGDAREATEFTRRETVLLLNNRLEARRRQIITTNLPWNGLAALFGDRITSRLREGMAVVQLTGPDRRLPDSPW